MTSITQIVEESDRWNLLFEMRRVVTQIKIDTAFEINIYDRHNGDDVLFTIRLGGNFIYGVDGGEHFLSAEELPKSILSPALNIYGKSVSKIIAFKNGDLLVNFEDQSYVKAPFDENYEAWEIYDSLGFHMISLPGGKLTYWSNEDTIQPDDVSKKS